MAVTVVSPPGYPHSAAFTEVALTLHHGLKSLGHDSVLTTSGKLPGRQHIVLGSNLLPDYPLPLADDAVLYNLEQVDAHSSWFSPGLMAVFRRHRIWDYSAPNVAALAALGQKVDALLPVGYVPELTGIQRGAPPDIDVLFFGSMNDRRKTVLLAMQAAGLQVVVGFGAYGAERDALIARAKVVVNIHYYQAKVLEMVRISYLLANRCAVLSEPGIDPDENASLEGSVAFAEGDELVRRAIALVSDEASRKQLAQHGFEWISARPVGPALATLPVRL
jgi:hypothetical protein